jgi:hypothetical protein
MVFGLPLKELPGAILLTQQADMTQFLNYSQAGLR